MTDQPFMDPVAIAHSFVSSAYATMIVNREIENKEIRKEEAELGKKAKLIDLDSEASARAKAAWLKRKACLSASLTEQIGEAAPMPAELPLWPAGSVSKNDEKRRNSS